MPATPAPSGGNPIRPESNHSQGRPTAADGPAVPLPAKRRKRRKAEELQGTLFDYSPRPESAPRTKPRKRRGSSATTA